MKLNIAYVPAEIRTDGLQSNDIQSDIHQRFGETFGLYFQVITYSVVKIKVRHFGNYLTQIFRRRTRIFILRLNNRILVIFFNAFRVEFLAKSRSLSWRTSNSNQNINLTSERHVLCATSKFLLHIRLFYSSVTIKYR
jgi:hypothetical protein